MFYLIVVDFTGNHREWNGEFGQMQAFFNEFSTAPNLHQYVYIQFGGIASGKIDDWYRNVPSNWGTNASELPEWDTTGDERIG